MRIWIDLVNSPHVLFFLPIIRRLEGEGHSVLLTYRDFAQTKQLVENHGLSAELIGGHGGKSRLGKIKNLCQRTLSLIRFIKNKKIDLALSHNSYFQLIAAKFLGIKSMTSMDFEGQPANHLAFRLASLVSVPSAFPKYALDKFGAKNYVRYQGLKEDVCLADFEANSSYFDVVKEAFNLNEQDVKLPLIVVRPPPTAALYHNNDESLFDLLLDKLSKSAVTVLILPRIEEQKVTIDNKFPKFFFSDVILDGLQLINVADMVISGGGSMNREAACLNTPAISFFSGELPEVDRTLEKLGLLQTIKNKKDLELLAFTHANSKAERFNSQQAINDFMSHINSLLRKEKK